MRNRRKFQSRIATINPGPAAAELVSWMNYDGSKDGSPLSFSVDGYPSDVVIMSSTRAVAVYVDAADSNKPKAKLLNISGTTPTILSSVTISTTGEDSIADGLCAGKIDSQYLLVVGRGNTNAYVINTGSDTLAVVGTPSNISGLGHGTIETIAISDNINGTGKLILFYADSATGKPNVVALTPNTGTGATTAGPAVVLDSSNNVTGGVCRSNVIATGGAYAMVCWAQTGGARYLALVSLSGTTITFENSATKLTIGGSNSPRLYVTPAAAADEVVACAFDAQLTDHGIRYLRTSTSLAATGSATGPVIPFTGIVAYAETINGIRYYLGLLNQDGGSPDLDDILSFVPLKLTAGGMWVPGDEAITVASTLAAFGSQSGTPRCFKMISATKAILIYRDTFGGTNLVKAFIINL